MLFSSYNKDDFNLYGFLMAAVPLHILPSMLNIRGN